MLQEVPCNLQEELRSPSRDAVERPGTPDTCLDCNVSPCSLSVSDDPSNLLELDQGVLEDLGQGLATMSLLENGSKGHKKGRKLISVVQQGC